MRRHPSASRFDWPAGPLISRAMLYIKAPFISLYAYSSYNSSGQCSKKVHRLLEHLHDAFV